MTTMTRSQRVTTAGLLMAVGLVLPFVTAHAFGIPGTLLLPMHLPVLLIGFLCGPLYGLLGGVLIPLMSSLMTNMPVAFPMLPIMLVELSVYGTVGGLLYHTAGWNRRRFGIYPALLIAMVGGRIAYGLMFWLLTVTSGALKAPTVFAALLTGLPGIALQLILVPLLVKAVECNFHFTRRGRCERAFHEAIRTVRSETHSCVLLRDGQTVAADTGKGISLVIRFYEQGLLHDVWVADKIVGKAAAMLFVLGGVRRVHGLVMSRAAREYLTQQGVQVSCDTCIELISNRAGNGICPMEEAVAAITDEKEAYAVLKAKVQSFAATPSPDK